MASEGLSPVLKKSRWLVLKREENLRMKQRFRLRELLGYNLKTVRAENHTDSIPRVSSNSPSIAHLANYQSPNPSAISSDEPKKRIRTREAGIRLLDWLREQESIEKITNKFKEKQTNANYDAKRAFRHHA